MRVNMIISWWHEYIRYYEGNILQLHNKICNFQNDIVFLPIIYNAKQFLSSWSSAKSQLYKIRSPFALLWAILDQNQISWIYKKNALNA